MRSLRIAGAVIAALVAVSAVLLSTPSPASATTTYTAGLTSTTGTTADWGNQNGMSATQVTTGANGGTLASVSLNISAVQAAPANHGQVAVYADASNAPSTLLASSASKVLTANSWNVFTLPTVAIAANTRYWLAFNVDGANTKYAIKSGSRSAWKIPTTFGTWPATFGTPSSTSLEQYALYMSYTDTPPPPPPTTTAPPPPPPGGCALPAYPKQSCTGVPAGTVLTDVAAPYRITQSGTVLDGVHVPGDLLITANNVTIRNSVIDGWIDNETSSTGANLTVTDTTIGPVAGCNDLPGLGEHDFTATRVQVRNHGDGFRMSGDNVTVRDSWFHACDSVNNHDDGLQAYCPGFVCHNLILDHNTLDVSATQNFTAPVFGGVSASNGQLDGASVTNNLLDGGVFTIYMQWHVGNPFAITGNRLVNGSWTYASSSLEGTCSHVTWTDNQAVTVDAGYNVLSTVGPLSCL